MRIANANCSESGHVHADAFHGVTEYPARGELCRVLSDLKNAGNEIVLVSSGAIGMGVGKLGFAARPQDMPSKQACAAVGQCELMYVYDKLFAEYNHTAAQILLTAEDLRDEKRH